MILSILFWFIIFIMLKDKYKTIVSYWYFVIVSATIPLILAYFIGLCIPNHTVNVNIKYPLIMGSDSHYHYYDSVDVQHYQIELNGDVEIVLCDEKSYYQIVYAKKDNHMLNFFSTRSNYIVSKTIYLNKYE